MAAKTRWVQIDPAASGKVGTGGTNGKGTRAYSIGVGPVADTIDVGSTTNRLYVTIGGEAAPYITLYSGTALDPRFVARDITEKLRTIPGKTGPRWENARCTWENQCSTAGTYSDYGHKFKIYSGDMGSSASVVVATTGTNNANTALGYAVAPVAYGGTVSSNAGSYVYDGGVTVSGTYKGLFDETYKIVISCDSDGVSRGIGTPTKGGSNTYDGTLTTGGVFNSTLDATYVLNISTTNGATMGAGQGNVPKLSWTSSQTDDSVTDVELLYPDHWINIGQFGLMVKFSDAVFNTASSAWTIVCNKPDYAQATNVSAPVGIAKYVWSSSRGDQSSTPVTTSTTAMTQLGTRGLSIQFTGGTTNLAAGDEFLVFCAGVIPSAYNITSLNYGNVTVSTESDVKAVMFEVESGAVEVSTVRFGLQSHGTFTHHNAGNNDTMFRFGTVGPAGRAGTGIENGIEWYPGVTAADIDSNTPPTYLYRTKANLGVVSTADSSESVGSYGLTSDAILCNIKLGSNETGANSSINLRLYFDYA